MTDCTNIPTLEEIEAAKVAMDDINSFTYLPGDTFVDGEGVTRDTVNGRLKKMGYAVPINYTGGIVFSVSDNTKTVEENNVIYAPFPSALPFTTIGNFSIDSSKFFNVQLEFSVDDGASRIGTGSGSTVQLELDALSSGQIGGIVTFISKVLLDAFTPSGATEEKTSYKVTNDSTSSNNGYYHWNGLDFIKDAELVQNVVIEANNSEGVSGKAVFDFVDEELSPLPIEPDLSTEVEYFTPDYLTMALTSVNLINNYYGNPEAITTEIGILKDVSLRTHSAGPAIISVFEIISESGGDYVVNLLHIYDTINAGIGNNNYVISDNFPVPVGAYLSINCQVLFYKDEAVANTLRVQLIDETAGILTIVKVSANYTLSGAKLSTTVIDKPSGDIRYELKTVADARHAELNVLPHIPDTSSEVDYFVPEYLTMGLNGGSTGDNWYGNPEAVSTEIGIIKEVSLRSISNTTASIAVFRIVSENGTIAVENLHIYNDIDVTTGDNTYPISDNFTIPVGSYLTIKCDGLIFDNIFLSETLRVNETDLTEGFRTIVKVAANYTLSGAKLSTTVIDESSGDKRYQSKTNGLEDKQILPPTRKQVLTASSKIILYGDSISSTNFPWYKEEMEIITGAQVYNGGFSGHSAAQGASDADLQRIFDYEPNVIVSLIGGNDTGAPGTVGTFDGSIIGEALVSETDINIDYNGTKFIQAISHIIRKIQAEYYNIRERANLTGGETEQQKEDKINDVLKPYLIFASTLKQQRFDANNNSSKPENWQRKRDAVVECCIKYDIPCVDLFNAFVIDMSLEPYWVEAWSGSNDGIYTLDGLHPNKFGFRIISELVCSGLQNQ